MAIKVTDLTEKITLANNDVFMVEDIAGGATKKVTRSNLFKDAPINDGSVTGSMLADNTVTKDKLANPVAFLAHRTTNQSYSGGTWTKLQASTETYDYGGNYNNSTYRFTAPVNGVYHFGGNCSFSAPERALVSIYKNGSEVCRSPDFTVEAGSSGARNNMVTCDLYLVASDFIECYVWSDDGGAVAAATTQGGFYGHLVGQVQ